MRILQQRSTRRTRTDLSVNMAWTAIVKILSTGRTTVTLGNPDLKELRKLRKLRKRISRKTNTMTLSSMMRKMVGSQWMTLTMTLIIKPLEKCRQR